MRDGLDLPHILPTHVAKTTFHWIDIRGYSGSGASTMYEDSVHGTPTSMISWSGPVPAYSTIDSTWIVGIFAGRGYVW